MYHRQKEARTRQRTETSKNSKRCCVLSFAWKGVQRVELTAASVCTTRKHMLRKIKHNSSTSISIIVLTG